MSQELHIPIENPQLLKAPFRLPLPDGRIVDIRRAVRSRVPVAVEGTDFVLYFHCNPPVTELDIDVSEGDQSKTVTFDDSTGTSTTLTVRIPENVAHGQIVPMFGTIPRRRRLGFDGPGDLRVRFLLY